MVGKKKIQSNPIYHISPTQPNLHGLGWTHELDKFFIIIKLSRKKKYKDKYI